MLHRSPLGDLRSPESKQVQQKIINKTQTQNLTENLKALTPQFCGSYCDGLQCQKEQRFFFLKRRIKITTLRLSIKILFKATPFSFLVAEFSSLWVNVSLARFRLLFLKLKRSLNND